MKINETLNSIIKKKEKSVEQARSWEKPEGGKANAGRRRCTHGVVGERENEEGAKEGRRCVRDGGCGHAFSVLSLPHRFQSGKGPGLPFAWALLSPPGLLLTTCTHSRIDRGTRLARTRPPGLGPPCRRGRASQQCAPEPRSHVELPTHRCPSSPAERTSANAGVHGGAPY